MLDFVNTVTGRDQTPRDWLDGYPRLLEWAGKSALLPAGVLRTLADMARSDPAAADDALQRAKQLREALFGTVTGMIRGKTPSDDVMILLTRGWHAGVAAHELRFGKHGVQRGLCTKAIDLDLIAHLIAFRFVDKLMSEPHERLRMCAGSNCAWLFLDRSKAGRRRWCDMAVCGNAAKSRRFQARLRKEKKTSTS